MSNYVFYPPQQNYHNNQKIDLGDIRISKLVQVPEVSKIIFNGEPLMDLTNDTVTPEVLMNGYTAHAANGEMIVGNMQGGGGEELANSYTAVVNNEYRMGTSCANMFYGNTSFNKPVMIGDNVTNCYCMFKSCSNFNQPVNIGNNVTNCYRMFYDCTYFNQPVTIPNNVTHCYDMFYNCKNLNQPVTIPNNVINCGRMFYNCTYFNQPVTIPNKATHCSAMIYRCTYFNQPITIPDNVTNCSSMIYYCTYFNQPVTIGNNVDNCAYMFYYCTYLNQNIYIKSTKITNVGSMLYNHNNQKQINLFCTNLASLNKTTAATSLTGKDMSWTSMTNGYYNATYNIYLYNNLPSGI